MQAILEVLPEMDRSWPIKHALERSQHVLLNPIESFVQNLSEHRASKRKLPMFLPDTIHYSPVVIPAKLVLSEVEGPPVNNFNSCTVILLFAL